MTSTLLDVSDFIENIQFNFGGIFAPERDIFISRAPARLDVMGGIADYSGSLVLEMPLKEATLVGMQKRRDRRILVRSLHALGDDIPNLAEFHLDSFYQGRELISLFRLGQMLKSKVSLRWAAYVIGLFAVLLKEKRVESFEYGANIGISTHIPLGAGISSSAALEVATLRALDKTFEIGLDPLEIPRLCQITENRVVGAPCGIMDQMTSALGRKDHLLALRCQPSDVISNIAIPHSIDFVGINSQVRHSVGGTQYRDTRAATFMGRKVLYRKMAEKGLDLPQNNYLCNIDAKLWQNDLRKLVPARLKGQDFVELYEAHEDFTEILLEKSYPLKKRTDHPIMENFRTTEFMQLLESPSLDHDTLVKAGSLMYDSHISYSKNAGLGCKETDLIVQYAQELGPDNGIYGAKITGGGSGGTVVLMTSDENEQIKNIVSRYKDATGLVPDLFIGSSEGAVHTPIQKIQFG